MKKILLAIITGALIITAVSCGPAAPWPATPSQDCKEIHDPDPTSTKMITVCPEPGPKNIDEDLRWLYNEHMKAKEAHDQGQRSDQPAPTRKLTLIINIDTAKNGQAVQDFIEQHDTGVVDVITDLRPPNTVRIWVYNIDLELVPTIAAMDGVAEVKQPPRQQPAGSSPHPLNQSSSTALASMSTDAWHIAGLQGQGIEIAIIDETALNFGAHQAIRVN